jgi:hypothetical protein
MFKIDHTTISRDILPVHKDSPHPGRPITPLMRRNPYAKVRHKRMTNKSLKRPDAKKKKFVSWLKTEPGFMIVTMVGVAVAFSRILNI